MMTTSLVRSQTPDKIRLDAALQLQREGVVEQCVVAVVRLRSDVVQRHVRESWEGGHA